MLFTQKSSRFFHKNFDDISLAFITQKNIMQLHMILSNILSYMNQLILLSPTDISSKTICLWNIKAAFVETQENTFDVVLEINSNKFVIAMQSFADQIYQFEIIAIKWFIELSNKIILTLKKLVEHLRYRAE